MPKNKKQESQDLYRLIRKHIKSQQILQYYPYGPTNTWSYWSTGTIDLRQSYKNYKKTHTLQQLYIDIIKGATDAIFYFSVYHPEWIISNGKYNPQYIEALSLYDLFTNGICGYTKKPCDGLPRSEQIKLFNKHYNISRKVSGISENDFISDEHRDRLLSNYGVFVYDRLPLFTRRSHKPLYSYKELSAIKTYVDCAFENLC